MSNSPQIGRHDELLIDSVLFGLEGIEAEEFTKSEAPGSGLNDAWHTISTGELSNVRSFAGRYQSNCIRGSSPLSLQIWIRASRTSCIKNWYVSPPSLPNASGGHF